MTFHSFNYLLFLPLAYAVFALTPVRARWCVLLAASLFFYASLGVSYLLAILVLVTSISYVFGLLQERITLPKVKLALLWTGILAQVLILVLMKYLPFLSQNLAEVSSALSLDVSIKHFKPLIAIGVSYFVFQAISYQVDVYLGITKPERHVGYFSLYMAFFPKLLQGPIERAADLLPQLKSNYEFNADNLKSGLLLFLWGVFKKVVVADRIGQCVDFVYNDVHSFGGLPLLLATYAYALQIYMDFSGYTDMALGSARLFNINLTQNFNRPYLATSVAEFWRRWHISFSRWILDYVFKPVQMSLRTWQNWGAALALVLTFLVSGVWHGASWGFVIWGALHGLYMASSVFWRPYQKKIHKHFGLEKTRVLTIWQRVITFHLVCFAWIFFRANSVSDALYVVKGLFSLRSSSGTVKSVLLGQGVVSWAIMLAAAVLVAIVNRIAGDHAASERFRTLPIATRWLLYYGLMASILILGTYGHSSFLYFQF